MLTIAGKRARFAELHAGPGCFVIPNPWDVGSTRYLASLGFKALATTSAGAAFAAGLPDGGMTRKAVLAHIADLVAATDLPFNADYEAGFAATRDELHDSVTRCIATGVAGFSLEDYTGDPRAPFYGVQEAADRIRVARAAIDASGERVLLTARSEAVLRGHPDGLNEALRRLTAYAEAGADVLYAPGLRSAEAVGDVVRTAGAPAGQCAGLHAGADSRAARGPRRPARQRRRLAGARRLGRLHERGAGHRAARTVRQPRPRRAVRRAQPLVRQGSGLTALTARTLKWPAMRRRARDKMRANAGWHERRGFAIERSEGLAVRQPARGKWQE